MTRRLGSSTLSGMATIETAAPLLGAIKLLAYVRKHYDSIPAFCEAKGLDRYKVEKAIKGKLARIDIRFGEDVSAATNGDVKSADWIKSA